MSDPRITLARRDLARTLTCRAWSRPAATRPRPCAGSAVPTAALRKAADPTAEQWDQLLFGELFRVLDVQGRLRLGPGGARDGYVGFVAEADLSAPGATPGRAGRPTRWRSSAPTPSPSRASSRGRWGLYSLNALTSIEAVDGRFAKGEDASWFTAAHLAPMGVALTDYVAVAEGYLGAPYQWGGRESLGLDCSGLVQQAPWRRAARPFRATRTCSWRSSRRLRRRRRRRGDLVFWKGHVAILLDADTILHANAHHMAVAAEPLAEAVARVEAAGGGPGDGVAAALGLKSVVIPETAKPLSGTAGSAALRRRSRIGALRACPG